MEVRYVRDVEEKQNQLLAVEVGLNKVTDELRTITILAEDLKMKIKSSQTLIIDHQQSIQKFTSKIFDTDLEIIKAELAMADEKANIDKHTEIIEQRQEFLTKMLNTTVIKYENENENENLKEKMIVNKDILLNCISERREQKLLLEQEYTQAKSKLRILKKRNSASKLRLENKLKALLIEKSKLENILFGEFKK